MSPRVRLMSVMRLRPWGRHHPMSLWHQSVANVSLPDWITLIVIETWVRVMRIKAWGRVGSIIANVCNHLIRRVSVISMISRLSLPLFSLSPFIKSDQSCHGWSFIKLVPSNRHNIIDGSHRRKSFYVCFIWLWLCFKSCKQQDSFVT